MNPGDFLRPPGAIFAPGFLYKEKRLQSLWDTIARLSAACSIKVSIALSGSASTTLCPRRMRLG